MEREKCSRIKCSHHPTLERWALIYHLNFQKENGNPVFFFDRRVLLDSKRKTALQESILCNRHQFEGLVTFFIGYNVFSRAPFGRSRGRSLATVSDGSSDDFPCFDFFSDHLKEISCLLHGILWMCKKCKDFVGLGCPLLESSAEICPAFLSVCLWFVYNWAHSLQAAGHGLRFICQAVEALGKLQRSACELVSHR